MYCITDAPWISGTMRTGYPVDEEYYETDVKVWETEDGVMTKDELIAYMVDYIKTNTEDAALALLGIEHTYITVECDAYGEPI